MAKVIERAFEDYVISTDPARLDLGVIHGFLRESYWAEGIPREIVARAVQNSLCFGVYFRDEQIAFARVVSDYATFAYIADVFVLAPWRGRSISKALMAEVVRHPDLQGLRRWLLGTKDAHGLYQRFGFTAPFFPERQMERADPGVYLRLAQSAK
ncbi:MAG TPA: GNAT family N-acetyltransferase [Candidatus Binataceae bacterium]|nr:GNAT family N-acetyltransferase [Candidatus Binataceae bacterium]